MRLPAADFCLLLALVLGSRGALGDTRPPVDIPALREAQAQDAAIAAIDGQMQRGEWQAARDAASAVLERSKSVWHGALQLALVRVALLEAKLGQDEALWHWQALQAMGGTSLGVPFYSLFGAAGEKLRAQPTRVHDEVPPGVEGAGAREGSLPRGGPAARCRRGTRDALPRADRCGPVCRPSSMPRGT
jgi:hypothetical protein